MKKIVLLFLSFICWTAVDGQQEHIQFNLSNAQLTFEDSTTSPFFKFQGEWKLREDAWSQDWGYGEETIKIKGHHTLATSLNTPNSLLQIIDGPAPNGHCLWSYNPVTKMVHHLSSFGTVRIGVGTGYFDEKGDLFLKVAFEGEAEGTYRRYSYQWINPDSYELVSIQYDENDKATGLFYRGIFERVQSPSSSRKTDSLNMMAILSVLDNNAMRPAEKMDFYTDDLVHMAPQNPTILNKEELTLYLERQEEFGNVQMKHFVTDWVTNGNLILMNGGVKGTFTPRGSTESTPFKTKNQFVFRKTTSGELKIWKVLYNASPL